VKRYAASRDDLVVGLGRKALPQYWYNVSIGRSNFKIALTFHSLEGRVGCEIFIRGEDAKKAIDMLAQQRQEIKQELGQELEWQRLEGTIGSRIAIYREGRYHDPNERDELISWLVEMADRFYRVFAPRVRELVL